MLKNLAFTISKTNFIIYNTSFYNITSIKTSIFLTFYLKIISLLFFIFPLSLLCLSVSQPNYSQHRQPPHPPTIAATSHQQSDQITTTTARKKGKNPQPIAKKNPQTKSTKSDHYSFDPCFSPCSMVDHQDLFEHQHHQTQIDYPFYSNPTKSHHLHSNPTKK